MFKLLAAAVFGAISVNAETDIPVFSSNDDYDEINLNIRLLAAHSNTTMGMKNATKFEGFIIKGSFQATVSAPDGVTAASMDADATTKTAMAAGVANATGMPKMAVTVTKISDASRRLEVARKLAVSLTLKVDYELMLMNKKQVDQMVMYVGGPMFGKFLETALGNELAALGADYAVSGVSSLGATVASGPGVTTAAPGATGTTAAPAATTAGDDDDDDDDDDSSNASMIKMNAALIAAAAMVASLF